MRYSQESRLEFQSLSKWWQRKPHVEPHIPEFSFSVFALDMNAKEPSILKYVAILKKDQISFFRAHPEPATIDIPFADIRKIEILSNDALPESFPFRKKMVGGFSSRCIMELTYNHSGKTHVYNVSFPSKYGGEKWALRIEAFRKQPKTVAQEIEAEDTEEEAEKEK